MKQLPKITGVILFFIFSVLPLMSQINYSNSTRLNEGWEFLRGDLANAWEAVRDYTKQGEEIVPIWSNVTLPHCYNAFDAVDPDQNYYQGPAWYRTLLHVENPYKKGRTLLHFEGVGQKAEVYIHLTKGDLTVTDEISFDYETRPFGTETNIRVKLIEETLEYSWIEAELVDQNGVRGH